MEKTDNSSKEKKQPKPEKPQGMTEFTDQDLEQVQGGFDDTTGPSFVKVGPGDDDDDRRRRRRRER